MPWSNNMKVLREAGIIDSAKIGDKIRGWDFEKMPDRMDRYIEGIVTEIKYGGYVVKVLKDTLYPVGHRTEVVVPMEGEIMWDWENRVEKIA